MPAATAQNTPNPAAFYKHMLGWNRRALKVQLPVTSGSASIRALETLCVLSARAITR